MRAKHVAALMAAVGLLFSSCQSSESARTDTALKGYLPGAYIGTAMGMNGPLEVKVKVDEKRIVDIAIGADRETPAIGGEAAKLIKAAILKKGSPDFDAVSGATVTSNAVKDALEMALTEAKGQRSSRTIQDGKYVTKAMGHEGFVHVATVFRGGVIESCKVIRHDETMGIGNYAAARIPPRIVKAQSVNVDSVSGATVTSSAVKAAVAEAIVAAGGNVAAFQKAPAQAQIVKETVERRVDVVIAGAGTAGLMAGARLAEQGKTVLIFEKADIPGGSMPMTYGGVVSSGTKAGAAYGLGREKNDTSWNGKLLLELYSKYARPEYDRFNKAIPYKTASIEASGPMVDWMREIGIGFEPLGVYEGGLQLGIEPYLAPGCYQGGAGYAAMFLADRIVAKGSTIVYATPVVSLIAGKDGRISGLRAEGRDGKTWLVSADAVLLATGGFANNKEMIAKYYPAYKSFAFNAVVGNTGEGMMMAIQAGAGTECLDRALGAFPAVYGSNYEVAFINMIVPGLMANGDGSRLADTSHVGLGNAKLDPANKGRFYYVFDDEGAEALKKSMKYGFSYASVFDRGEAVKYGSLAEAAKKLNLPSLVATVEANNKEALENKPKRSYIETRDGVWLIRIDPSYYLTTGGIMIDTKGRVLTQEGKAIPGLYAAGDIAGSVEEKDGLKYGYGFDSALSFGYIAADTIGREAKK